MPANLGYSCNNEYCSLVLGPESNEWTKESKYLLSGFISCYNFNSVCLLQLFVT